MSRCHKQNILVRRPHIKSPAAYFLLRRHYESIVYYQTWEKHRKEYLATQQLCCHYCKRDDLRIKSKDPDELATIDHVIPRALGGRDCPSNYVVACGTCNQRKGTKLIYQCNPNVVASHPPRGVRKSDLESRTDRTGKQRHPPFPS